MTLVELFEIFISRGGATFTMLLGLVVAVWTLWNRVNAEHGMLVKEIREQNEACERRVKALMQKNARLWVMVAKLRTLLKERGLLTAEDEIAMHLEVDNLPLVEELEDIA